MMMPVCCSVAYCMRLPNLNNVPAVLFSHKNYLQGTLLCDFFFLQVIILDTYKQHQDKWQRLGERRAVQLFIVALTRWFLEPQWMYFIG